MEGPSEFADDMFGDTAAQVRDAVVKGLIEGERQASAAQLASGMDSAHPYSFLWLSAAHAVAAEVLLVPGSSEHTPPGSQYSLAAINGRALLPMRLGSDHRKPLDEATFAPSELRRRLITLGLLVRPDMQMSLFGPSGETALEQDQPIGDGSPIRLPVVVIGYIAAHDSGLLSARWGLAHAVVAERGRWSLDWRRHEPLDLTAPLAARPLKVVDERGDERGFADGPMPQADLGLLGVEEADGGASAGLPGGQDVIGS
jgi:hypothetical protein